MLHTHTHARTFTHTHIWIRDTTAPTETSEERPLGRSEGGQAAAEVAVSNQNFSPDLAGRLDPAIWVRYACLWVCRGH